MPRFSVIIPCYNAIETLPETLESILSQTYGSLEVICVDDGSTDATPIYIQTASQIDKRIKLVRNTGKGPSTARNLGAFDVAIGEIIAFCDADDIWSPTKLAELDQAFADPFVDAAYGKIAFFKECPASADVFSTVPKGSLTLPMLLGENPVCTMSNIAVRQCVMARSGGFDTDMVHNEDLEWLIRMVGTGADIVGIDSCQVWYRASTGGLSSDLGAMMRGRECAIQTAKRFGYAPTAAADAIYHRYLSRRSLRLGMGRTTALRYALRGVLLSPAGFFNVPKRGALTLAAAICTLFLPAAASRQLFAR